MKNGLVYLIGFMGTGKTTVSKSLGKMTGLKEQDTDKMIEEQERRTILKIFSESGEEYFRNKEAELIERLSKEQQGIISCGGGIIIQKCNVELMKESGVVVWLQATPETILKRVKGGSDRPLLNGYMNISDIKEMMNEREERYLNAMDFAVQTDGKTADDIAEEILEQISK